MIILLKCIVVFIAFAVSYVIVAFSTTDWHYYGGDGTIKKENFKTNWKGWFAEYKSFLALIALIDFIILLVLFL